MQTTARFLARPLFFVLLHLQFEQLMIAAALQARRQSFAAPAYYYDYN